MYTIFRKLGVMITTYEIACSEYDVKCYWCFKQVEGGQYDTKSLVWH